MSSIITAASQNFRSEVLRGDRDMLRQLSQAYTEIARRLTLEYKALLRDIAEAQRQGKTVSRDWLRRSLRYQSLIRQAQAEISNYSTGALRLIESRQRSAIDLGQFHAADLIQRGAEISFARLPSEAINEMVGVLQDGSPLSKVLERLGGEAAGQIKDALVTGLATGKGAAPIARQIRSAIDVPQWKALQIARTETMRAYRQSTLATYAANSDVLNGWIWTSTLSTRTCAACWSLHGTFFPLSKQFFPGHVSCRCTSTPSVKGSDSNITAGAVKFAELPAEQQQTILGPSRYEMYQQGMKLSNFVSLRNNGEWGESYQIKPLNAVTAHSHSVEMPKATVKQKATPQRTAAEVAPLSVKEAPIPALRSSSSPTPYAQSTEARHIWDRIPGEDQALLEKNKVTVHFSDQPLSGAHGMYYNRMQQIVVGPAQNEMRLGTLAHETGHAVDNMLGMESGRKGQVFWTQQNKAFLVAVKTDLKNASTPAAKEYRKQIRAAYAEILRPPEIFADLYATQILGVSVRGGLYSRDDLAAAFPQTTALLRKALRERR